MAGINGMANAGGVTGAMPMMAMPMSMMTGQQMPGQQMPMMWMQPGQQIPMMWMQPTPQTMTQEYPHSPPAAARKRTTKRRKRPHDIGKSKATRDSKSMINEYEQGLEVDNENTKETGNRSAPAEKVNQLQKKLESSLSIDANPTATATRSANQNSPNPQSDSSGSQNQNQEESESEEGEDDAFPANGHAAALDSMLNGKSDCCLLK